ncbi:hypothetical protein ACM66B_003960 [Microbotryomycetes sp. NB124-2]
MSHNDNDPAAPGMSTSASSSAPFTQAIPQSQATATTTAPGQVPTLSQSGASIEPMPSVLVQQRQQQQQQQPAQVLQSANMAAAPVASTSAAQQPQQDPVAAQAPAAVPVILTGFAAVQSIAAAKPNPVPYTEPPPYDPVAPAATSNLPPPTGIVGESAPRQVVSNAEVAKMDLDQQRDLQRKGKAVLREDDVRAMDIDQLRRLGLGRTPSGAAHSSSSRYEPR